MIEDEEVVTTSKICFFHSAPGLYYFQTEGESQGQMHLCIVHVKEAPRHYGIEVTDRRFNPRLLTVKTGDRVWWHWNKFKVWKIIFKEEKSHVILLLIS